MRNAALLAAATLSTLLSGACRRTVTVRVPEPYPVVVEVDRCRLVVPALPAPPTREVEACEAALGAGAACYAPGEAHRLALLLDILIDLYEDAASCETGREPQKEPEPCTTGSPDCSPRSSSP
jgi:hypothetical protein